MQKNTNKYLRPELLVSPVLVIQRTHGSQFKPSLNTMHMEGMITDAPRCNTVIGRIVDAVRLAFNAWLHEMISTNGTSFDNYIPRPKSNSSPLFNLKSLLPFRLLVPLMLCVMRMIPVVVVIVVLAQLLVGIFKEDFGPAGFPH